MIEVKIVFTNQLDSRNLAYISYACPKCGKDIVSFQVLHKCYNCKAYAVSGGLLVNSTQYRLDYHIGKVAEDGNTYI